MMIEQHWNRLQDFWNTWHTVSEIWSDHMHCALIMLDKKVNLGLSLNFF